MINDTLREWWKKAEEADCEELMRLSVERNPVAMHKLGDMYASDEYVAQNEERAVFWYNEAKKVFSDEDAHRDVFAAYNIASLSEKLGNKEIAAEWYIVAASGEADEDDYEDDYDENSYQYEARKKLAQWYLEGTVFQQDTEKACYWIANAFSNSDAIVNEEFAKPYYKQIAEYFIDKANGVVIKDMWGYRDSSAEAKKKCLRDNAILFYTKAAENGDVDACKSLLQLYEDGEDDKGTERISEILFEHGEIDEDALLDLYRTHGNRTKVAEILEKRAENGTAEDKWNLGVKYASGNDIYRDMNKALYWHEKAAESEENADWLLQLGNWFNNGKYYFYDDYYRYCEYSIERDAEKASLYLEKAFSLGAIMDEGKLLYLYQELGKTDKIKVLLKSLKK